VAVKHRAQPQAVTFLVIGNKPRKTLQDITRDLCPVLSIQQLYRISTMYWDDVYQTETVSSEVRAGRVPDTARARAHCGRDSAAGGRARCGRARCGSAGVVHVCTAVLLTSSIVHTTHPQPRAAARCWAA
jgi:hypothetical protein